MSFFLLTNKYVLLLLQLRKNAFFTRFTTALTHTRKGRGRRKSKPKTDTFNKLNIFLFLFACAVRISNKCRGCEFEGS